MEKTKYETKVDNGSEASPVKLDSLEVAVNELSANGKPRNYGSLSYETRRRIAMNHPILGKYMISTK